MQYSTGKRVDKLDYFCLFVLLLYVPSQQLWSWRDDTRCITDVIELVQAFRFMVGPGHCPMISKYGPSLSKAVGPVDPSFLGMKKSH